MDIAPDKQNIDRLFASTDFHIDFYQREYKWTEEEVTTLLNDIFYRFKQDYRDDLEPNVNNVEKEYQWYYLNTYITNRADGKTFVVDGQQRLTTISLILVCLYHLCEQQQSARTNWVRRKILGDTGEGEVFWMGHGKRKESFKELFEDKAISDESVTASNMRENYKSIAAYLTKELTNKHRLETFVFFFLTRLVLVQLDVAQTDVPMVFEVINDRGVRLRPYEILKGKLLGQIHKNEVEHFTDIWEQTVQPLEAKTSELVDDFFRTYLKAKFADTRAEGRKFDGDYQRAIFEGRCETELQLKKECECSKAFH